MSSIRRRVVLATVGWTAAALLLLVLLLYAVLEGVVNHSLEQALDERVAAARAAVADAGGDAARADLSRADGQVAVVDGRGEAVAGVVPASLAGTARDLATAGESVDGEVSESSVVRYEPLGDGWGIVAAEDTGPYEDAEHLTLTVAVVLSLLTVGGVALVSRWAVGRSLQPVREMAAAADEWGEHDTGHRFRLGTPDDEIAELGTTLDHLLDRVSAALRTERRLTGEVAHELRTPLTRLLGTTDLALLRDDLDPRTRDQLTEVRVAARSMADTVTTLVDLARSGAHTGTSRLGDVLDGVDLSGLVADLAPDERAWEVDVPAALVQRALGPLLDNARRHAASTATVRVRRGPDEVVLVVHDDGPGTGDVDPERPFEPRAEGGDGTGGLGLPLARRVARAFGGDVRVAGDGAPSGASFELRLPARRH